MATYYEILNVDRYASKQDIKTAFKRLAVKYHPDHNPGNASAEEHFKQINEAYQTLSDDLKKQNYDLGLELLSIKPTTHQTHYPTNTYQQPVYNTTYEPYKNTYDPANYVSKSLKIKIKVFAGLFMVLMCVVGVFTYQYMSKYTAAAHYEEALNFFEKKKYRAALAKLGYTLEFNKNHLDAYFLRARINSEIYHNYIMALDDFNFVIEHQKEPSTELFYKKGMCYFNLYDFDNAIIEFDKSIQGTNVKGEYYYYLALSKIKSEKKYADICQNLDSARLKGVTNFDEINGDYCP